MFDFDASKLLIIGVVALVVIGPKDLPRVLRQVGQMVGKLRRMAAEFQGQFMDAMKEADLADLQKEIGKLKDTASLDVNFNPVHDVRTSITEAVGSTAAAPAAATDAAAHEVAAERSTGASSAASLEELAPPPAVPAPGPAVLELVEAAHHTPAEAAGAVHSVEADATEAGRRRIVVAKRRPPGDRAGGGRPAAAGRGRPFLPPRRDPRP